MRIKDIQVGDVITVANGAQIEVKTMEPSTCTPGGFHINGRLCFASGTYVERSRAGKDGLQYDPVAVT